MCDLNILYLTWYFHFKYLVTTTYRVFLEREKGENFIIFF